MIAVVSVSLFIVCFLCLWYPLTRCYWGIEIAVSVEKYLTLDEIVLLLEST